jgi:hypothetical protein
MPYRRLPKTDAARLNALKILLKKLNTYPIEQAVSYETMGWASSFLPKFENLHRQYTQSYTQQIQSGKKHQINVKRARLYISHFIQVLNLSVIREEIKPEQKKMYRLSTTTHNVPDLSSDTLIDCWGRNIINGEQSRCQSRGIPIYNPSIAKVKVFYDLFQETYQEQKKRQEVTNKYLEKMLLLREEADRLLLQAWNEIEAYYATFIGEEQLNKCRAFGVIYYYRASEKKKMKEHDKIN